MEAGSEGTDAGTVTLIQSGMMHQLNLIGGMIWQLCDGSRSLDEIVAAMAGEFDVSRDELRADVEVFVKELVDRGWLSRG